MTATGHDSCCRGRRRRCLALQELDHLDFRFQCLHLVPFVVRVVVLLVCQVVTVMCVVLLLLLLMVVVV